MPPLVDPFTNNVWYQVPQHVDRSKFVPGKRITEGPFVKGSTTLSVSEHEGKWWAHVGVPVQPEEFLTLSGASVHPECHKPVLPVLLEHAVDRYCSLNNTQRSELRVHVLKGMIQRAQELADQEREVHAGLQPHARDVLKGKRLLLFQDLLSCMNFQDVNLVQDMQQGFRLTGWLEDTSVRPTKYQLMISGRPEQTTTATCGTCADRQEMTAWTRLFGIRHSRSVSLGGARFTQASHTLQGMHSCRAGSQYNNKTKSGR